MRAYKLGVDDGLDEINESSAHRQHILSNELRHRFRYELCCLDVVLLADELLIGCWYRSQVRTREELVT